jgi:transposase-like protein
MRRTRDEWIKIIESYHASGLTVRRFCRRAGVSEQSLRNWIRRIDLGTAPASAKEQGFVEVGHADQVSRPVAASTAGGSVPAYSSGLTLRLPSGVQIDVHFDTDRRALDWVVALLGNLS